MSGRDVLTFSELRTFAECEQKHEWRYRRGLVPDRREIYLDFGHVMHEALADYYRQRDIGACLQRFDVEMEDWHQRASEQAATTPEAVDVENEMDFHRRVGRALLIGHDRHHDDAIDVLAVELEFRFRLRNPDTGYPTPLRDYAGKVDLVVIHPDGRVGVWDHKVIGSGKLHFDLDLYRQVEGYRAGVAAELDIEPDYVLYNVLRKPSIQQRKDESLDDYEARLTEDVTSLRPEFYFFREGVYPPPWRSEEFASELWRWHQRMLTAKRDGALKDTTSCMGMFGRPCPYLQLCRDRADHDDAALQRLIGAYRRKDSRHEELTEVSEEA